MELRICTKCGSEYPLTNEYFYTRSRGGYRTICKSCFKKRSKENTCKRYKRDADFRRKIKEKALRYYYEKSNPQIMRERSSKYYYVNRNTDKFKARKRRKRHVREARLQNLDKSFTIEQWLYAKDYFNNRCAYCGAEKDLTQDHFIPLSKNGEYSANNIIPSCKSCNSSKRDKDFFEWYPKQESYSRRREKKILTYLNYDISTKTQQLALVI